MIGLGTVKYSDDIVKSFVQSYGGTFYKPNIKVEHYDKSVWPGFSIENWQNDKTPISVLGCLRGTEEIIWKSKQHKIPYYFIDHPYFFREIKHVPAGGRVRNRKLYNKFYRVTKNADNLNYILRWEDNTAAKNRVIELRKNNSIIVDETKMRNRGDYVLLLPPTEHICRLYGYGTSEDWIIKTKQELSKHTDRKIVIKKKDSLDPLEKYLKDAYCMVSSQTTAAIQGLLKGIPSICEEISCAAPVSKTNIGDINNLYYPNIDELNKWIGSLLSAQFSYEEIANGTAKFLVEELQN